MIPAAARKAIVRAWSSGGVRGLLRLAILEQWAILRVQQRTQPRPKQADELKLLGLYLVAAFVLIFNEYAPEAVIELLPKSGKRPARDLVEYAGWAWTIALGYSVVPLAYARFVLGMSLADLGLRWHGLKEHAWLYAAMLACVLPLVVLVSFEPHFQSTYPFYRRVDTLPRLLAWELSYGFQFVTLELFFRGFLLFFSARVLGPWAIVAMTLPYMMIHFGKPLPECIGSIAAGFVLGLVALRTRSIFAGMFVHIAVAWSMDSLSLWQSGRLAKILAG
jgi:membrane protease YdiL (CAAX protease family)